MMRFLKTALQSIAVAGFVMMAFQAAAEQPVGLNAKSDSIDSNGAVSSGPYLQLAAHSDTQVAALPMGTIRLRVIPRIGGKTMHTPITWRIETYGRDSAGKRHQVAEVTDPTPELVLPAGWYIAHAQLPGKLLKHPVEVTAGRTFKYTLVKN